MQFRFDSDFHISDFYPTRFLSYTIFGFIVENVALYLGQQIKKNEYFLKTNNVSDFSMNLHKTVTCIVFVNACRSTKICYKRGKIS